jgi:hypothetical protein
MTKAISTLPSRLDHSPWFHLLGGPILWAVHFLFSYAWLEFACRVRLLVLHSAVFGLPLLSWFFISFTVLLTFATVYIGWSSFRDWKHLRRSWRKNKQAVWELEARQFMAFSGILLGPLFSLVILLSGLPALVLGPCGS